MAVPDDFTEEEKNRNVVAAVGGRRISWHWYVK